LKTVSGELAKDKLDLVGVQEVRWDKGDTEPAGDYTFFYGNGNADHHLGTGFFVHQRLGRPLGRPRRRWEDNRDRWRALVNTVMNLWVP
jgi:hypothetical protein